MYTDILFLDVKHLIIPNEFILKWPWYLTEEILKSLEIVWTV